jgi:iron complex outermembrane receptor protein
LKNFLLLGAALLALPCTSAWAQGPVSGTVTDARAGTALPGATILLDGAVVGTTDATGTFAVPAVPAGSHTLRITFVGYAALEQTIQGQAAAQRLTPALQAGGVLTGEALVTASRANDRTATAYTNMSKEDLARRNFGQDLPYLLDQTPSVVVNSDAGAGVGYTDIRIRGTSNTGINMTINGVPLNDAESHGSFLVNLPDLASSINSLQIQRGVGTSQNGGAAFGASINISTLDNRREAYGETQNSFGSFGPVSNWDKLNTWKNTVSFGTGLLSGHFTVDGRLSRIASDGYMRRAASDLKSYYLAAGYQNKSTLLKFITFSGREKTYQAWNGVPEPALTGDRAGLHRYVENGELSSADSARAVQEGRRYSYYTYDNQTDNYQQNHYQLHLSQGLGSRFSLGTALHLTRGFGYYESYRANKKLADYNLDNVVIGPTTIKRTDLVDRKWLDNYFYGGTVALNYQSQDDKVQATVGGAWNRFLNDHYGEVIWARYASNGSIRQRYYFNDAVKTDYNAYGRVTWQVVPVLSLYGDLQVRRLRYNLDGLEAGNAPVSTHVGYTFRNPKAGLTITLPAGGQREPVRSDFTDRPVGDQSAKPERLDDFEGGYRLTQASSDLLGANTALRLEANFFYMKYKNQLVATGQLNDVGTALRTNAPRSYRRGLELTGFASANDKVSLSSTLTVSRNRIQNYRDVRYDADYNPVVAAEARTTTVSYSPSVISAHTLEGQPLKGLRVALLYKTVSRQYLDNSTSEDRRIRPYQVLDFRVRYAIRPVFVKEIELGLLVNNLLNREYVANGYTYGYVGASGQPETFNWYFPQATRNFLASVGVKF